MYRSFPCQYEEECRARLGQTATEAPADVCASVLRDASKALLLTPANVITSISVTCPQCYDDEDVQQMEARGKLIAEEYDLDAEIQTVGCLVTVVFRRRGGITPN